MDKFIGGIIALVLALVMYYFTWDGEYNKAKEEIKYSPKEIEAFYDKNTVINWVQPKAAKIYLCCDTEIEIIEDYSKPYIASENAKAINELSYSCSYIIKKENFRNSVKKGLKK